MDGQGNKVKIPPVGRVWSMFNKNRPSIFNLGGKRLMKIPYQQGDRVIYYGFGGQPEPGTVDSCEYIDAGYSRFIRIIINSDRHKSPVQFNLSLFPDRVKKMENDND